MKDARDKIKKTFKWFFSTKKRKIIFSLFFILLIILPLSFYFFKKEASASWWNESWFYRKSIPVTNSSGTTLTDFQFKILNNYDLSADITAGKIQADLDDLRFTSASGTVLDYWIEDATGNSVDIWAKLPTIPTSGATVYMYYGNASATIYSDGNKVFDFFDDFNSLDASRWSATGAYNITGGKMTITTGAVYSKSTIQNSPQNSTIEMKAKYSGTDNEYSGICISNSQVTSGDNSTSKALAYNMSQSSGYSLSAWGADGSAASYNIANSTNVYSQTLNTDYIIGYTFQGASNIKYFVKNLAYTDLGSTTPAGTWSYPFYLWFGSFIGNASGESNIDDLEVDWVRLRKYASVEPATGSFGTEEKSPAPVLHLSFDEGYGTTAYDKSSNKNNGTITGATWKNESECVSGKCLRLASGNMISVADSNQLDFGTDNFTISAWALNHDYTYPKSNFMIKKSATCFSDGVINLGFDIGHGYKPNGIDICIRDNLNNYKRTELVFDAGFKPSELKGKWVHYEFVFNRSGGKVLAYINGVKQTNELDISIVTGSISNTSALQMGTLYGWMTDGKYDDIKIYPYTRTDEQIKQDYNAGLAGISSSTGTSVSSGSESAKFFSDGLMGYWKMDEANWNGTTGEVKDASGNNNHGARSGDAAISSSGKFGNGGNQEYEGTGRLDMGDVLGMDTNNFSISMWTKLDSLTLPDAPELIDKMTSANTGYHLRVAYNNEVEFQIRGTNGNIEVNSADNAITVDRWYHITAVYDKNNGHAIYIDGNRSGNIVNGDAGNIDNSDSFLIGIGFNGWSLDGKYDEVRVYNRALSPDEVKNLYEYAPGPVAYWSLDENSGTVINDESGNNYVGSLGVNSGTPSWTLGKFGNGLSFGSGKYAKVDLGSTVSNFDTSVSGRSFSYSLWFKANSLPSIQFLLTNNQACNNNGNFSIALSGGNVKFLYYGSSGGTVEHSFTPPASLQANQWYHLEWTKTFGELGVKAYLNGVPQTVTGDSANLGSSNLNDIVLGAFNGDSVTCTVGVDNNPPIVSRSLDGSLDDIKIYNYIRNQEQVLEDFGAREQAGINPIEYWKFNGSLKSEGIGGSDAIVFDSGTANYSNNGKFGKAMDFSILESGTFIWVNNNTLRDSTKNWTTNQWVGYQFNQYYNGFEFCQDTINSNTATDIVFSSTCTSFAGSFNYVIKKNIYLRGPMPNQPTDKITGALWFKSNGSQNKRIVRAANESFNLSVGSNIVSGAVLNYTNAISYSTNPHDGRWHHLAIAWDGINQKLYYDGVSVASGALNGSLSSSNKILTIGARNDGNDEHFNGLIDEVKIYNYALDENEIKTLYNGNSEMSMGGSGGTANNNGITVSGDAAKHCVPGDNNKCDSPILDLRMDEMTGTTTYDKSGNGNNGTIANGPPWEISKFGGALNFNGNGKRITLATPFGQSGYTSVSLWYKRSESDSSSVYRTLIGHSSANIHHLIMHSTTRNLGIWDGSFRDFGYNPSNDGKWHFYEVIYNSGVNATLYVDGVYKSQIATTLDLSVNPIGSIGNWNTGTYWAGPMDEIKIYNYARTPAQIAWDYNQGKPVAHWKMDEAEGTQIGDWSGNAAHGTMINMDPATDRVEGKNNKALDFDGADDYVDCGTTVKYFTGVSYSAWINPDIIATDDHIIRKYSDTLRLKSGGKLEFTISGTDWGGHLSTSSINTGVWTHVVATFDDSSDILRYYINGKLDSELSYAASIGTSGTGNYSMYIGENSFPTQQGTTLFDGKIDDVKIYNYALTPLQVKTDYNNSSAIDFR